MEITKEQELLGAIISKAWEDASFKQELIENPLIAIEKLTGKTVKLSEGKTLVVRDQTNESKIYINIPAKPELDAELSEAQLENVAGGVIDGGCFPDFTKPPFVPGPTFPRPDVISF